MDDKINTVDTDKKNQVELKWNADELNEIYVHYSSCQKGNCSYNGCKKFKISLSHHYTCSVRMTEGKCEGCSEFNFVDISRYHKSHCENPSCQVFGCVDYRKSRQEMISRRKRRLALLSFKRRPENVSSRLADRRLRRTTANIFENNPQLGLTAYERRSALLNNTEIVSIVNTHQLKAVERLPQTFNSTSSNYNSSAGNSSSGSLLPVLNPPDDSQATSQPRDYGYLTRRLKDKFQQDKLLRKMAAMGFDEPTSCSYAFS